MDFIYLIKPKRENFLDTITDEESNIMSEHFEYLKGQLDIGKLILAGPVTTGKFGVVILEAEDEDSVRKFMLNDPAVSKNVMNYELFPFLVSLIKK